jgi:hypothetical protein
MLKLVNRGDETHGKTELEELKKIAFLLAFTLIHTHIQTHMTGSQATPTQVCHSNTVPLVKLIIKIAGSLKEYPQLCSKGGSPTKPSDNLQ